MAAAPPPKPGQRARKAPVLHATAYELPLLLPVLRMLPQPNKKVILATRNKKVRNQRMSLYRNDVKEGVQYCAFMKQAGVYCNRMKREEDPCSFILSKYSPE